MTLTAGDLIIGAEVLPAQRRNFENLIGKASGTDPARIGSGQERRRIMTQFTLEVQGMHCGMCESRVNEAVRKAAPVHKVTSSAAKGQTVIVAEDGTDPELFRTAIEQAGYTVGKTEQQPYEKKGLFSFLKK